jgi:hypothetical protein
MSKDAEYDWVKDFEGALRGHTQPPGPEWRDLNEISDALGVTINVAETAMKKGHEEGVFEVEKYLSRMTGKPARHWRRVK